jgi:diadenylate cyclase
VTDSFTPAELLSTVLDGAIVYFVIYRTLLIIKGTRAVSMLVGLVAIAVFYVLSQETYLDLPTFNWLLGQFIGSLFLIVVILFQADIRRALAAMGRAQLLPSTFRSGEDSQVIDELVKASVSLAQQKIGALIVVEREADLDPYMEESLRVDAKLSKELLYSLFVPERQNPLHDGACVVRRDRVEAAGVFLPMSVNPNINRTFGTRHRAALGLSEETDAVVIVVSEERASISLAFEGGLETDLKPSAVRERLTELLIKRPTRLFRRDKSVVTFLNRRRESHDSAPPEDRTFG